MTASRSASEILDGSKPGIIWPRPRAHRLRVADQLAQGLGRKILRRAHGLAEVGPELADTCTLHAVARHALDREHLLPAPRRRIGGQAHVDRHLRPAVRGRFHSRERYRLIRPLLAPDARALRMLPHEIERPGALLSCREDGGHGAAGSSTATQATLPPDAALRRPARVGAATRSRRRRAPRWYRAQGRMRRRTRASSGTARNVIGAP